jgi:hypothetical protein
VFEEQVATEGLLPTGSIRQQRAVDAGLHMAGQNGS